LTFIKNKLGYLIVIIINIFVINYSWSCNFNCKYDSESFKFEISEKIPLWKKHIAVPNGKPLLFTDLKKNNYPNCKLAIWYNSHKIPYDFNGIIEKYGMLAAPNYYKAVDLKPFVRFDDLKTPDKPFEESIYKIHHACLDGSNKNSCSDIIKIVEYFAKNKSMTDNYMRRTLGNNQDYWISINRILIPLIVAYSSAIQVENKPDNHEMIGNWLLTAFYNNAYNPLAEATEKRERDMFRETSGSCYKTKGDINWGNSPAQNHSLTAAELAMMYGVLWNDTHMFQVGLDGYNLTLDTVNEDGILPCEAIRGGMAVNYSGSTIHSLLNIYKIASMQGYDLSVLYPEATNNLHKAVSFLLGIFEDEKPIHKFAVHNKANDQCNTIKKQCFHSSGNRANAFGWTRLYKLIFKNNKNINKLNLLKEEFINEKIENTKRAKDLTALFIGHYQTKDLLLNLLPHKSDTSDLNQKFIDDLSGWARGSPRCLYDTTKILNVKSFKCVSNPFIGITNDKNFTHNNNQKCIN
tara:strand:+ start:205 stop:1764 length:1560 start_codon:yes stop_codon:yes gene_type:complete